ncbi:hypothetical protein SAMN05660826_00064 [Caldanaerovirga acetigignens]|uniref:Uncharacterized protein n=1 Tax=Caldanaerovirga acetigignens TaxID=447595 RepID=A0A1M7FMF0_9FIRM|nr:hypothetical protein SAMN05660826_00064 [Caldanaerovirga acetigignens]
MIHKYRPLQLKILRLKTKKGEESVNGKCSEKKGRIERKAGAAVG